MIAAAPQARTPSARSTQERSERALATRLRTVAPLLLDSSAPQRADPDPASDAARTLDLLVRAVVTHPSDERIWLLLTAVAAAYPTRDQVDQARRALELAEGHPAAIELLELCLAAAEENGEPAAELEVVIGGVVVDVDHTAQHDLHTGIQRVTRSVLPIWIADRDVVPVAWTGSRGALRRLSATELTRVAAWSSRSTEPESATDHSHRPLRASTIIVPWRSVVVMVEVPPADVLGRVAGIGDHSGNRLVGVAYDAIPVASADMVPAVESIKFVRYLTALKFAARMAGISRTATREIGGFIEALATQGLRGPVVGEISLPSTTTDLVGGPRQPSHPTVLAVGSHEPRKNHLAVLHSAETLWREGLQFSLEFIGGSGWGQAFPERAAELQEIGRPIAIRRAVSESDLNQAYQTAAFSVFPSLHEGFGLPVAESLAHGTPVITSNFGSTAEIGQLGGAVLIDPRDHGALTDAMRGLLSDPQRVQALRDEIAERPVRTWRNYADELWDFLVDPELMTLRGDGGGGDQDPR